VRIEQSEPAIQLNPESATARLQAAVHSVGSGEAASVYKQVAAQDQRARKQSMVEMANGYLAIKSAFASARTEVAQNEPNEFGRPYDSVPHHGARFKEADGQEYYWNFASQGTTEEDYKRLKEQYGDQLVDHKTIKFFDEDGTPDEGMILKWRVPGEPIS